MQAETPLYFELFVGTDAKSNVHLVLFVRAPRCAQVHRWTFTQPKPLTFHWDSGSTHKRKSVPERIRPRDSLVTDVLRHDEDIDRHEPSWVILMKLAAHVPKGAGRVHFVRALNAAMKNGQL